jgi:hypothetical protein
MISGVPPKDAVRVGVAYFTSSQKRKSELKKRS